MVKDYNIDIHYHPWKTNVVVDALSRMMAHSLALNISEVRVQRDFKRANIVIVSEGIIAQMARLTIQPTIRQRIIDF